MNIRSDHTEWTDRFSDFIGGDLPRAEHEKVEAHLLECGACRRVLEDLNQLIADAASLGPIDPPRDLWGGIAATIQAPPPRATETKVIALPVGQDAGRVPTAPRPRRLSFSLPQLAAAAVVLIAGSSLATWSAGFGVAGPAPIQETTSGSGVVGMVSRVGVAPPEMADELAALEATLRETEAMLDPNTVRVLERNLAVIEKAIEDSRRALMQDPENAFLAQHLERVFERKLTYLRDAARVAEWSS